MTKSVGNAVAGKVGRIKILSLPHHGGKSGLGKSLLRVKPSQVVISVGGHRPRGSGVRGLATSTVEPAAKVVSPAPPS